MLGSIIRVIGGVQVMLFKQEDLGKKPINYLFQRQAPLVLEVGCGHGHSLIGWAQRNPGLNVVGIEMTEKYAGHAARRLDKRRMPNAVVIQGDATAIVANNCLVESVAWIVINFPDPWWKSYHHKRRLVNTHFAASTIRCLLKGGRIFCQSDVFKLIIDIMAVLESQPQLHNPAGFFCFYKNGNHFWPSSLRESKSELDGIDIFRVMLIKKVGRAS